MTIWQSKRRAAEFDLALDSAFNALWVQCSGTQQAYQVQPGVRGPSGEIEVSPVGQPFNKHVGIERGQYPLAEGLMTLCVCRRIGTAKLDEAVNKCERLLVRKMLVHFKNCKCLCACIAQA